jgi:hypothetical protein
VIADVAHSVTGELGVEFPMVYFVCRETLSGLCVFAVLPWGWQRFYGEAIAILRNAQPPA